MDKLFVVVSCCITFSCILDINAMDYTISKNGWNKSYKYLPQYETGVYVATKDDVENFIGASTHNGKIAYIFNGGFEVCGYGDSIYQERFYEALSLVLLNFSDEYDSISENSDKKLVHGTPNNFSYLIKAILLDKRSKGTGLDMRSFVKYYPDIKLPNEDTLYSDPIPNGTLLIATPDDVFCNMQQYLWLKKNIKLTIN